MKKGFKKTQKKTLDIRNTKTLVNNMITVSLKIFKTKETKYIS